MQAAADTHVHIYPAYDAGAALAALMRNLDRTAGPDAAKLGLLTERRGCHWFASACAGGDVAGCTMTESGPGWLGLRSDGGGRLYLFPGRQIVTAERLEVLALTIDVPGDMEGRPAREVVAGVLEAGGVPVLSWSPGKWLGARGALVRSLVDTFRPGELLLGDTPLRPRGWGEPILMRRALRRGLGVVAGTDPLPLVGEERRLGSYATVWADGFDPASPVSSIRAMLRNAHTAVARRVGRRLGPVQVLTRLIRIRRQRPG